MIVIYKTCTTLIMSINYKYEQGTFKSTFDLTIVAVPIFGSLVTTDCDRSWGAINIGGFVNELVTGLHTQANIFAELFVMLLLFNITFYYFIFYSCKNIYHHFSY